MGIFVVCFFVFIDYYKCGQYIFGFKVNGMDVFVVKVVVKYGKEWIGVDKGFMVFEYVIYCYGGYFMFDFGIIYCICEEIQCMCFINDFIVGFKQRIFDWGVLMEEDFKKLDKEVCNYVNEEVVVVEVMVVFELIMKILFEDIYVFGFEFKYICGCIVYEDYYFFQMRWSSCVLLQKMRRLWKEIVF